MAGKRRGRGEGSIEELPSGKWRAVLSAGNRASGTRHKVQKTFTTKREAITWRSAQLGRLRHGEFADDTGLTIASWLEQWLAERCTERDRGELAPGTVAFYEGRVADLKPHLPDVRLGKLTKDQCVRAQESMARAGKSSDAQRKMMTTLRTALGAAVESGRLGSNPAPKVKKPKTATVRVEVRPYDAKELNRLLDAARGRRMMAYFDLGADSGMRPGELLGLHWPDIDFDNATVRIERSLEEVGGVLRLKPPKSKAGRRTIQLATRTIAALRSHQLRMTSEGWDTGQGPVFLTVQGALWKKPSFHRQVWVPVIKAAGLRHLKPHGLRHTAATLLLSHGASVRMVSARLGHEDIGITLKFYAHVLPDDQGQATAIWERLLGKAAELVPPLSHSDPSPGMLPKKKKP